MYTLSATGLLHLGCEGLQAKSSYSCVLVPAHMKTAILHRPLAEYFQLKECFAGVDLVVTICFIANPWGVCMLHAGFVPGYGTSSCPDIVVIPTTVCHSTPDSDLVRLLGALCINHCATITCMCM